MVKAQVKWGKTSYDVDVDPAEGLESFQALLFSLTNVPVDRQKLMHKGKLLKSDNDIAALPADAKLMLMGTADALPPAPTKAVLFEEDLTEKDRVALAPSTVSSAGLVNLGNTCMPERDTRLLTDAGFLFLADIEKREKAGAAVQFACYQRATQSIVYRPGRLVVTSPPVRWVDFTEVGARRMWRAGSNEDGAKEAITSASRLSLRTTPDHDMYVQLCEEDGSAALPPRKMRAEELAPAFQCRCAATTCVHGYSKYRMLTGAAQGIDAPAHALSLTDRSADSPVVALGLRSDDEVCAFLQLYGFWLGSGSVLHSQRAVLLTAKTQQQRTSVLDLIARLHLAQGEQWTSCESNSGHYFLIRISAPRWFNLFEQLSHPSPLGEAVRSFSPVDSVTRNSRSSSVMGDALQQQLSDEEEVEEPDEDDEARVVPKRLHEWVLRRLSKAQLRLVIEGLRQADGGSAAGTLPSTCTSSVTLREQLVHAGLHAGYSAFFTLHTRAGEILGYDAVPTEDCTYSREEMQRALRTDPTRLFKPIRANEDSWRVHFNESTSECLSAQDVRFDGGVPNFRHDMANHDAAPTELADAYDAARDGRVWCVEVLHDDHLIFAQRAESNAEGLVTKVGAAVVAGNCYLASTLQAFRAVPELKAALIRYGTSAAPAGGAGGSDPEHLVTSHLGKLMLELDHSASAITPMMFTTVFRSSFAQFAERNNEGAWAQQDADECLQTLIQAMAHKLGPAAGASAAGTGPASSSSNVVDSIFGGTLHTTMRCVESVEEPERKTVETFRKLRCHIDPKISFLSEGLIADMQSEMEMRSTVLGRVAIWKKRSAVASLPRYLIVQFVRFDWRRDTQKKAKVLKKVEFPLRLDITDLCTPSLKRSLLAARRTLKDEEDVKKGLSSLNRTKNVPQAIKDKAKERDKDNAGKDDKKDDKKEHKDGVAAMEGEEEANAELQAVTSSGFYDLQSVITHKGRFADSGHYIGWCRASDDKSDDRWWKYDDDNVSEVKSDDIKALSGGGDWHMAYLLVYKLEEDFIGRKLLDEANTAEAAPALKQEDSTAPPATSPPS